MTFINELFTKWRILTNKRKFYRLKNILYWGIVMYVIETPLKYMFRLIANTMDVSLNLKRGGKRERTNER